MNRLLGAATLVLVATSLPAQTAGSEEAALRSVWSQFEEAFNRSDANKIASMYAEGGDRINADLEVAKGRAEVTRQYEAEFAKRKADPSTVPFHPRVAIRLLGPKVALLDGEWEGFRAGKKVRGRFTVIAQKGAGGWQIAAGRILNSKEM